MGILSGQEVQLPHAPTGIQVQRCGGVRQYFHFCHNGFNHFRSSTAAQRRVKVEAYRTVTFDPHLAGQNTSSGQIIFTERILIYIFEVILPRLAGALAGGADPFATINRQRQAVTQGGIDQHFTGVDRNKMGPSITEVQCYLMHTTHHFFRGS